MSGTSDRSRLTRSLEIIDEYQWMLIAHLARTCTELGNPSLLDDVARRAGAARGRWLRGGGTTGWAWDQEELRSAVTAWPGVELRLAWLHGQVDLERGVVSPLFGADELAARGLPGESAVGWWTALWQGVASESDLEWVGAVHFSREGASIPDLGDGSALDEVTADLAITAGRRAFGVVAVIASSALEVLEDARGADGVAAARQALREFGLERGARQRDDIVAKGGTPSLAAWWRGLDERDPFDAIYLWEPGQEAEPDRLVADCRYCPMAEAWRAEGPRALHYGELYDIEVHQGLVDMAAPGTTVHWSKLKTRGDRVCEFRFTRG